MKLRLTLLHKIILTIVAFAIAIVGFMVKLPSSFSHNDKVLHSIFYFGAAAFLNVLFAKRNIIIHAVIFALLYAFGVAIEYAQQYSNTFFHKRIHGNADPEDIRANAQGLLAFSACWLFIMGVIYIWKMVSAKPGKADVVPEVQVSDTTGAQTELQKSATKK